MEWSGMKDSPAWVYEVMLRAYPARLRREHGEEMKQLFADQLLDARASGHVARFWRRTLWDWLCSVTAERYCSAINHPAAPLHTLVRRGLVISPNTSIAILIVMGVITWRAIHNLGSPQQKEP